MGSNFAQAKEILQICRDHNLNAGINFQLRFSPQMLAVRDAIERGILGELLEIEMQLNLKTPWELWPFLEGLERIEIAVHSIHYLDLIRSLVGNPKGVFARTMGDPRSANMAQTRTSAIIDYGDRLRCTLTLNHNHDYGRKFQECSFRFEGNKGAIVTQIGVNLNYPKGEPDELWLATKDEEWDQIRSKDLGSWRPFLALCAMYSAFTSMKTRSSKPQWRIASIQWPWWKRALRQMRCRHTLCPRLSPIQAPAPGRPIALKCFLRRPANLASIVQWTRHLAGAPYRELSAPRRQTRQSPKWGR